MAYMSQEKKKAINAILKPYMKLWGIEYSLGVRHHSTLVLRIPRSKIDFMGNRVPGEYVKPTDTHLDINPYYWDKWHTGDSLEFFKGLFPILNGGNHDRSDAMTDYFDVGWYVDVKIGAWDKPYELTTGAVTVPPAADLSAIEFMQPVEANEIAFIQSFAKV